MVAALRARLADGGLLLVVRTEGSPPLNRASLFRRSGDAMDVVWRIHGGSDITDLVVGTP
jgi:hypothetical protein